jgi:hypothetical protein
MDLCHSARNLLTRAKDKSKEKSVTWPAAGFKDTELGVSMKPEVRHGATQVYARV